MSFDSPTQPDAAPPAYGPPQPYAPPPQPFGAPAPFSPAQPGQPTRPINLGAGVVAGLGTCLVAAAILGAFTGVTHYRVALLSIGVGVLVGWVMVKAAGGHGVELGVAAAIISLVACALGDVGTIYVKAMHDFHLSLSEVMDAAGPLTLLKDDLSDDKLAIVFFLASAYFAFRYAATGTPRRRPKA